jgi:hypothetical protein
MLGLAIVGPPLYGIVPKGLCAATGNDAPELPPLLEAATQWPDLHMTPVQQSVGTWQGSGAEGFDVLQAQTPPLQ